MNNSKALLAIAVIGALALYLIAKKRNAAGAAAPVSSQNLAYRGVNAVGASVAGDTSYALGSWVYDLVHQAYDPSAVLADANTLNLGNATISQPVAPSPAVLPYSYKQAVLDTPALLGTDAIFTPNAWGSAGTFAESGAPGTAFGPSSPDYTAITPTLAAGRYPSLLLQ